jgi:hypothetical protein
MSRDDDATRPITIQPLPRCGKPADSGCSFRDEEGGCTKRVTTCRWLVRDFKR